jgi:putative transposase
MHNHPRRVGYMATNLADRDFTADRPNRLWGADLTDVPTLEERGYMCFIIDAFLRRIAGWPVAAYVRTTMVLIVFEMARWSRGTRLEGVIAHSDARSQTRFNGSSQHRLVGTSVEAR